MIPGGAMTGGRVLRIATWTISLVLIAAAAVPIAPTDNWWVRALDFPRPQVAALLALAAAGALLLLDRLRPATLGLLAALLAAFGLQLHHLWPYTGLHPIQVEAAGTCPPADRLSVLVTNLRKSNSAVGPFLDVVRRVDPDLVFVVEVDPGWVQALQPLEGIYPYRVLQPRDDFWGLALYTRLDLVGPEVRHLLSEYVPSVRTGLRLRSGAEVEFHGLHPKPPVVGRNTAQRDAELVLAAQAPSRTGGAVVIGGDFNAVPWSDIVHLFQSVGGLLDPKIGRGAFVTFPTWLPVPLRVTIDHIFSSPEFRLLSLEVLSDVGSDHSPLLTVLCHVPGAGPASREHAPQPTEADLRRARETIQNGRADAHATGASN